MYDSSHAFGCSRGGKMIGGFGECEVFSFYATKFVNCFKGGVVTTNDSVLAEKMKLMRNFGFEAFDKVVYLGVNGKMCEISAAMGLTNLEAMQQFVDINRRNYLHYRDELSGVPRISLIHYDRAEKNNYQYVVMEVDPSLCGRTRDDIVAFLHKNNIIARKYFWPGCHKMEPYRSLQHNADLLLPETIRVAERVIVLPTGQAVETETVSRVCEVIRGSIGFSRK